MDLQHLRASDGTGEAVLAHIDAPRSIGSTVLSLDNVDNWNSKCIVVTGTPNASGFINAAGMKVMYGHLNAGDFIIDGFAPGYTDAGNTTSEVAIVKMTTSWADALVDLFGSEHKDNGKHKDVTADSLKINDGTDVSVDSLYQNAIINSACMVAQRASAPSITNAYQYGKVDMFAAKGGGTAVSAGTIDQNTSTLKAATKGYEIKLAGVTLTGTGIVYLRYRMEAKDALMFKNAAASFSCRIHHDVGSSKNATIYIRKANAADDFSAVTDIANSGAIAVANDTGTLIKFENINSGNLGDVSNGIEIEIQLATGAITTKNISFAEFQFTKSSTVGKFQPRHYKDELLACYRYLFVQTTVGTEQTTITDLGNAAGTTRIYAKVPNPVPFRTASPTLTATASDWQGANGVDGGLDASAMAISADPKGNPANVYVQITVSGATSKTPYVIRGDGGSNRTAIFSCEL